MTARIKPRKIKFNRTYIPYNPEVFKGPQTQILDTVVKPVEEDPDA